MATIDDIARAAGVSTATVSRALNGRTGLSEATRARVLAVADRAGYRANAAARAMATGRSGRIVMTLPELEHEYFAKIAAGAVRVLQARGLAVLIEPTAYDGDRVDAAVAAAVRTGVDGALLVLPAMDGTRLAALAAVAPHLVVVDPVRTPSGDFTWVAGADADGAFAAVEHLAGLGHRRIATVTGERILRSTAQRLVGYRAALDAAGIDDDPELVVNGRYADVDSGRRAALELFALDARPTAVFAMNDALAFGVLRAAYETGLRVPDDLSVVGLGDLVPASLVTPALTTVAQPLSRIGAAAAELLLRRLDGTGGDGGVHVQIPMHLVVRGTTGPPGAAGRPD